MVLLLVIGGHGQAALAQSVFAYERQAIEPVREAAPALASEHYRVYRLAYPAAGESGQPGNLVHALYYQSKLPGKRKLVIVLPIWGTHTYPSEKMTKSLLAYSDGDTNVLRILGENFLFDWEALNAAPNEEAFVALMYRMAERVRTYVIDIRRAVDWAQSQPEIDSARIGLIGFSMSANVAAGVLAHEPRVAAGALVMGGAHPHQMFASCFGRAQTLRENITARFGWSVETYERAIEGPFARIDPARFAGQVDPRRVIIFDAAFDTCVPKSGRDALWQAMGEPKRITWPWNHKMAFLMMSPLGLNTMRRQIYYFLENVFAELPRTEATAIDANTRRTTVR